MTNIIFALRQTDLTLLLFQETERFIFTQRAKYSGERYLRGRCFATSLNLSTESRLLCNHVNDTKKSAGFRSFDMAPQRRVNIRLNKFKYISASIHRHHHRHGIFSFL